MTDLEKAVSHWLPEVWTPGRVCAGPNLSPGKSLYCEHEYLCGHSISCPSPSRDLGFRLLEVMRAAGYCVGFDEKGSNHMEVYKIDQPEAANVMVVDTDDTLEMIIKAAAALAEKEQ